MGADVFRRTNELSGIVPFSATHDQPDPSSNSHRCGRGACHRATVRSRVISHVISNVTTDAIDRTTLNIAVVDAAAHLVAFLRMDNAFLGSIDLSQKKARIVTLFNGQAPSGAFYNLTQPGGELWALQETNGGLVPLGGGQPIIDGNGHFIGAVAVYAARSVGSTIEI